MKSRVVSFGSKLEKKYKIETLILSDEGKDMALDFIVVQKERRKQGLGTQIIYEICDFADKKKKRIILNVMGKNSHIGTTSQGRLIKFYKRFGFFKNSGKNKDGSIDHDMIRNPL